MYSPGGNRAPQIPHGRGFRRPAVSWQKGYIFVTHIFSASAAVVELDRAFARRAKAYVLVFAVDILHIGGAVCPAELKHHILVAVRTVSVSDSVFAAREEIAAPQQDAVVNPLLYLFGRPSIDFAKAIFLACRYCSSVIFFAFCPMSPPQSRSARSRLIMLSVFGSSAMP